MTKHRPQDDLKPHQFMHHKELNMKNESLLNIAEYVLDASAGIWVLGCLTAWSVSAYWVAITIKSIFKLGV